MHFWPTLSAAAQALGPDKVAAWWDAPELSRLPPDSAVAAEVGRLRTSSTGSRLKAALGNARRGRRPSARRGAPLARYLLAGLQAP